MEKAASAVKDLTIAVPNNNDFDTCNFLYLQKRPLIIGLTSLSDKKESLLIF